MKTFTSFIIEADELVPERTKPIQSSLPGLGKKSIEKKYQVTNKPDIPAKYSQVDPKQALMNYATEVETRGVAGGRRTPEEVKLSPEEIKNRTAQVRDTFAAADKGDAAAVEKLKKYQAGLDKKYGAADVPEVEQSKANRYIRGQQEAGIKVDPDLVDARGVAQSGQPEMYGQGAPSGQGARYRAASDAKSAGVADAGTRTPRPGVRSDSLGDAIRNVPDEPQLPRVTGGQPRVTDKGTPTNPYSQAELKREIINRRGRKVTLPRLPQLVSDAPGAPAQGKASIPLPGEVAKPQLPQPTRRQTVTAVQRAVTRNATQQGAAASATSQAGMNNWQRYLATNPTARNVVGGLRNLGRGLTALSAGLSFKDKYDQAKAAGASDTRAAIRGGVAATADVVGGLTGGTIGGKLGLLGGSVTGPGAVVTGTAGAITGGATGANVLRGVADQTFRSLAGPTQQQLDKQRQSNRKKFSDLNLPATNVANNRGIVTGKDGVERVGVRTYRPDGSTYYNVPVRPDTNPISRLAQDMNIPFLSGYYQRQADQQRQQRVRAQKAASR